MVDKENAITDTYCSLDELESSVSEEQLGMGITPGIGRKKEKEDVAVVVKETTKVVKDDEEAASDDEFMSQSLFLKRP